MAQQRRITEQANNTITIVLWTTVRRLLLAPFHSLTHYQPGAGPLFMKVTTSSPGYIVLEQEPLFIEAVDGILAIEVYHPITYAHWIRQTFQTPIHMAMESRLLLRAPILQDADCVGFMDEVKLLKGKYTPTNNKGNRE